MSQLRPDTIKPPAEVRKIADGEVRTYRHRRSRRILKAHVGRDVAHLQTRSGRRQRVVSVARLALDFVHVTPCRRCGGHHDVRRAPHA